MPGKTIRLTAAESETLCCSPLTESPLSETDALKLAVVMAALSDPVRLRLLSLRGI